MPAVSKAQWRFMQGVAHGDIHARGLSQEKAKEFIHGVDYKSLPASTAEKIRKHHSRHTGK